MFLTKSVISPKATKKNCNTRRTHCYSLTYVYMGLLPI